MLMLSKCRWPRKVPVGHTGPHDPTSRPCYQSANVLITSASDLCLNTKQPICCFKFSTDDINNDFHPNTVNAKIGQ